MADRNPTVAIAFLVLVLVPQMAVSGKYPRFTMSPRTKKQLSDFFKDHASDMADLFPHQGSSSDPSQSTNGGGSNNNEPGGGSSGGRSQAPATTAGKYIFSFDVGNPPQRVSGVLDISSELVWTQCACPLCSTTGTLFYPNQSSTMGVVPCTTTTCQNFCPQTCRADVPQCLYTYTYNGGTVATGGYLGREAFRFDSDPVNIIFGCGLISLGDLGGVSGVIGLGRGPYSLVSQLQAGRFAYYFAPDDSVGTESFIHFGDDAAHRTSRSMSTRLLSSSIPAYANLYYVGLSGIQVDGQDLPIPRGTFDLQTDGSGGVILSITIPVTFLDEVAYKVLRAALVSKIGLPTVDGSLLLGLDLCYTSQSLAAAKIPALALVFDGNNAVMELETWNYFYLDSVTGLECLAIVPSKAGSGSLLGNLIQAGTHMIYDVRGSMLMFESLEQQATPPASKNTTSEPSDSYGKGPLGRSSSAPSMRVGLPVVVASFLCVVVYMLHWAAF